jgi:RNA polymerase primary sigma factor
MMRTYVKGLIPNSSDPTDKLYIGDIDRVSPGINGFLTDVEARKLLAKYKESPTDYKLKEQIIHTYGRYVVSIAKIYQSQGLPLCDLISEGMLGLINAIDGFDPTNDNQFMTYAGVVISRSMREALDQFNLPVKVPKNIRNQHRRVKTTIEAMQLLGATEDQIQDKFVDNEVDLEFYHNPGLFSKITTSTGFSDDDLDNDVELLFVSDDDPTAELTRQDLAKDIKRIFKKRLTKTETKILKLYFGIDHPYRIQSTADLGKRLGMSGERARQIKEAGLQKLRSDDCRKILIKYL